MDKPEPLRFPEELIASAKDPAAASAFRTGKYVRMVPGQYVETERWNAMLPSRRFLLALSARWVRSSGLVLCGETALFLAGLPTLGPPPVIEVASPNDSRSGANRLQLPSVRGDTEQARRARQLAVPALYRHKHAVDEVIRTGDFTTVPLMEATMEVLALAPLARALTIADGLAAWGPLLGLHWTDLLDAAGQLRYHNRRERAVRILKEARSQSGSPGESASRAIMFQAGFDAPSLQEPVRDSQGLVGYPDFTWKASRVYGEFDGMIKYSDAEMTRGSEPGTVLGREKQRESRLMATGYRVLRWGWQDIMHPERLINSLRAAGVGIDPRRRWITP